MDFKKTNSEVGIFVTEQNGTRQREKSHHDAEITANITGSSGAQMVLQSRPESRKLPDPHKEDTITIPYLCMSSER